MRDVTDMTLETVPISTGSQAFEQILNADVPLLTLESSEREAIVEQFRQKARFSGQAMYRWHAGDGLCSLRETGLRVPGCLRLGDTLRYISMSMHFGIYLIDNPELPLSQGDMAVLRRIASTRTDFVRRVVLLSEGPELSRCLGKLALRLKHEAVVEARLRLRGGRWV
ncbi:MAG TPA: hypothetical protein VF269_05180 [Rhodanobacteraceae bacterium]